MPSETKQERRWRTRPDPFDGSGRKKSCPCLTIIEWLEERFPGRFSASQLRTLQRRLQDWRALNGPDQELYFPQEHPPGREAQLDPLQLPGSNHRRPALPPPAVPAGVEPFGYAEVVAGETFVALKQGLLWELGGADLRTTARPSPDKAQPRPGPERQLRRAPGALRDRGHADIPGNPTRMVAEQAHYRLKGFGPGPRCGEPRLRFRRVLHRLRQEGG